MSWEFVATIAGYLLFVPLLWWGGNAFCRAVLRASGAPAAPRPSVEASAPVAADEQNALAAGRSIGILERSLILIGILTARWEVVAGVIALKTVARYKELDKQLNAEYFLIGSLASILWAALLTLALFVYDNHIGFDTLTEVRALLAG